MASYKVPQDVEADDKLLGPFSFRQFLYLIVVAGAGTIAWLLGQIFIGLIIIPLPVILLFGALALPLRKEQPMEAYLAAMIQFYFLKSRKRLWDPDGQQALVEITAPRKLEEHRTKDISQDEADRRFSYLANVVDSQGWAVRGVSTPTAQSTPLNQAVYTEAQQANDILDTSTPAYHEMDNRLDQAAAKQREELVARMHQPQATSRPTQRQGTFVPPARPQAGDPHLTVNPYPDMRQSVIQPLGAQQPQQPATNPQQSAQSTSDTQPSPDIINLANNSDLSVETIAHEAKRIQEKHSLPQDEVLVSLH